MRLWSFHPMHLDDHALRAVWRHGLEAVRLIRGERSWRGSHPSLDRWRAMDFPVNALGTYLHAVHVQAQVRELTFKRVLIPGFRELRPSSIPVTAGQIAAEFRLYLSHLHERDVQMWEACRHITPKPHPLFRSVAGEIEPWDRELVRC